MFDELTDKVQDELKEIKIIFDSSELEFQKFQNFKINKFQKTEKRITNIEINQDNETKEKHYSNINEDTIVNIVN